MNNDNFILLVGESGSGKTSVADELYKRYGLSQVISYTTREKRYEDENNHIFITEDEFEELENLVGYTEYNGCHYGATAQQVEENYLYVIDLDGVDYFMDNYNGSKNIIVIYLSVPEKIRLQRLTNRDGMYEAINRINYDKIAFKNAKAMADITIENIDINKCVEEIYNIWKNNKSRIIYNKYE